LWESSEPQIVEILRHIATNNKGRGQKAEARASSTKRGGQQRVPSLLELCKLKRKDFITVFIKKNRY
jgi:hypothetical protein